MCSIEDEKKIKAFYDNEKEKFRLSFIELYDVFKGMEIMKSVHEHMLDEEEIYWKKIAIRTSRRIMDCNFNIKDYEPIVAEFATEKKTTQEPKSPLSKVLKKYCVTNIRVLYMKITNIYAPIIFEQNAQRKEKLLQSANEKCNTFLKKLRIEKDEFVKSITISQ